MRKLLSLPCAAGLQRDLLSSLDMHLSSEPDTAAHDQLLPAAGMLKRLSLPGGLFPAALPGGRGKSCCSEKTRPDRPPGKVALWAREAVGLCSTQSSLHLTPPPAPVMGDPSKSTGAAEYSLWQRQIALFWPNFLPSKKATECSEDLETAGREASSGCEHLTCRGMGELCPPCWDGGTAASGRGQPCRGVRAAGQG